MVCHQVEHRPRRGVLCWRWDRDGPLWMKGHYDSFSRDELPYLTRVAATQYYSEESMHSPYHFLKISTILTLPHTHSPFPRYHCERIFVNKCRGTIDVSPGFVVNSTSTHLGQGKHPPTSVFKWLRLPLIVLERACNSFERIFV